MKKKTIRLVTLLLALCMVFSMVACGEKEENSDGGNAGGSVKAEDLFYTLMTKVTYDAELTDAGDSAAIRYMEVPESAQITMYVSTGMNCSDELTWIRLAQESDMETALDAVASHLEEESNEANRYYPQEMPKIEAACIWHKGTDIIVCVTNDYANAQEIMDDPSKVEKKPAGDEQHTEPATEAPVEQDDPTEPATEPPVETDPPIQGYPAITSQSGTWRDCGNAMIVDNMAYEYYGYSESAAKSYTSLVSKVGQQLQGQTNVYCLVIPTAVGVVFPDDVKEKYSGYEDQGARLEQIYNMLDSSVIPVNIFEKMMQHRDEYLYYRTDWHWSGIGAYYGYEKFCEVKGVTPYTMDQRREHIYEGYLGPLYSQTCGKDAALAATPDTVYAYEPYFDEAVSMVFTDTNGNRISWPVIADGDSYNAGSKYLIFAAGDQPIAEFTNSGVTDGSVAIVVKESFGNAMMSYFVDHYSTVYEIDYRHWNGDLVQFAREVGADDIIFANNIGMVRSSTLIGRMSNIIP